MKNIRILATLVVLALLLTAFSGCDAQHPQGGTITPNNTNATTEATTKATEATQTNSGGLGRMEGGTYTNEYAGFAVVLDEKWTYYTAEELQDLPDNVKDLFADSEIADNMEKYTYITDMMAENATDLTNINILYQKLTMADRLQAATKTEEALIDSVLASKDLMLSSYQTVGIDASAIEKATLKFLGENHFGIKTTASVQGVPCYISQIILSDLGAYSVTLTVTTYNEDNTQAILDLFIAA